MLDRLPYVSAVEPLARVSWADPDTDNDGDRGILVTPGVMFHFGGQNMLAANLDIWSPSTGDTEYSVKLQTFFSF